MSKPLIRIRSLKELQSSQKLNAENAVLDFVTPIKAKKAGKRATPKKNENTETTAVTPAVQTPVATTKRIRKSALKEPPPSQLRIDTFFKSCQKTYKIPKEELPTTDVRRAATEIKGTCKRRGGANCSKTKSPRKRGRKRLFPDETSTTTDEEILVNTQYKLRNRDRKLILKTQNNNCNVANICDHINLISDCEDDTENRIGHNKCKTEVLSPILDVQERNSENANSVKLQASYKKSSQNSRHAKSPLQSTSKVSRSKKASSVSSPMDENEGTSNDIITTTPTETTSKKRKPKICPSYKIIEGTTFAVDAFQFGTIVGVTHYFLTHFHMDHYIGLTRKFCMPLYMSNITANLVRTFIPLDDQYIHELNLNDPVIVNNIEITALDANHCPGAIMLLFKFLDTGKCILHTGDFRAWYGMESEPVFWNNDINTIYLDTTYISQKYQFSTQYESIQKAIDLLEKFKEKHVDKRILYICGSYVIGKEKFWSSLAKRFELKVWSEEHRRKALNAINDIEINELLTDDPLMADMHIITMGKISYLPLVEYFSKYEHQYDILLAIRPSGWEKDSRPQYRGKINIIGVEYSEHSSYEEMQRFVKFLKPQSVISTVPTGRDLMKTAKVPEKWYKYKKLQCKRNYQPCIEQFLGKTPLKKECIRMPNAKNGGVETFVSPISKKHLTKTEGIKENHPESIVSIASSEREFEERHYSKLKTKTIALNTGEQLASSQNLKQAKHKQQNKKTNSKRSPKKGVADSQKKVNVEILELSQISKKSAKIAQKQLKKTPTLAKIRTELNNESNNDLDLELDQNLKDGNTGGVFIPKSPSHLEHKIPSSAGSSDYFEMPLLKDLKQRRKNARNGKNHSTAPMPKTIKEEETAFENGVEFKPRNCTNANIPSTSRKSKIMVSIPRNPLLESTSSAASSLKEEIPASQTSTDLQKTPRPLRNKVSYMDRLENDIIPASQTSTDLQKTPRPIRSKLRHLNGLDNDEIPASQTSKDLEKTPRPLRNKIKDYKNVQISFAKNKIKSTILENTPRLSKSKMPASLDLFSQEDIMPATQNSKKLENTPSPARHKRSTPISLSSGSSSPKKPRSNSFLDDSNTNSQSSEGASQRPLLTQIMNIGEVIDIYNTSQLAGIVAAALANKSEDSSSGHIPPELRSDPDANDDWMDSM